MSGAADEAARVDRIDRGVRPVRRAGDLREVADEVGVRERLALHLRSPMIGWRRIAATHWFCSIRLVCLVERRVRPILQRTASRVRAAEARLLKGTEVVALAHPHERLAAVVHLFEIRQRLEHRRERHVGPVTQFSRCPRCRTGPFDDFARLQTVAVNLLDRLVEPLYVVGHIDRRSTTDRSRRCRTGRPREAVFEIFSNSCRTAAAILELEMEIVDEEHEDAA